MKKAETKFRLFELKGDDYYTLFHGVNGSRKMPIGTWIKAKQCITYDGSPKKTYRAGFHVFTSPDIIPAFLNKFRAKRTLVVARVLVRGRLREKPTNEDVMLAPEMFIINEAPVYIHST
jgi:hypothetical protein